MAYNDMTYADWRAAYDAALADEISRTEMRPSEVKAAGKWGKVGLAYLDGFGPRSAAVAAIMEAYEGETAHYSNSPDPDDHLA